MTRHCLICNPQVSTSIIVMWISRKREYTADQGAAFGIRPKAGGMADFFTSHPPLEDRIKALQNL
jgi:Zn-dependent protease with chaperone function